MAGLFFVPEDRSLTWFQLCLANGDTKIPLAIYHRKYSQESYIEIFDRSLLDTLDVVIST